MSAAFGIGITIIDNKGKRKTFKDVNSYNPDNVREFNKSLKENLILVARDVLREEQADGFDEDPRVRVDNRFDAPIEGVKPFGKIEFFARQDISPAILSIYEEIHKRSPVGKTATYVTHNIVLYNGQLVAKRPIELRAWLASKESSGFGANDIIRFVNTAPYARRLENRGIRRDNRTPESSGNIGRARTGKSAKTGLEIKKPNGAYQLSYRVARRKYKSVANFIKFAFIPGGSINDSLKPSGLAKSFGGLSGNPQGNYPPGRPYLYPSIVLQLNSKGITSPSGGLLQ